MLMDLPCNLRSGKGKEMLRGLLDCLLVNCLPVESTTLCCTCFLRSTCRECSSRFQRVPNTTNQVKRFLPPQSSRLPKHFTWHLHCHSRKHHVWKKENGLQITAGGGLQTKVPAVQPSLETGFKSQRLCGLTRQHCFKELAPIFGSSPSHRCSGTVPQHLFPAMSHLLQNLFLKFKTELIPYQN